MFSATTHSDAEGAIGGIGLTSVLFIVALALFGGLMLNQDITWPGMISVSAAIVFVTAVWIRSGSNGAGRLAAVGQAALWASAVYGIGLFLAPAAIGAAWVGRSSPGVAAVLVAVPTTLITTIQFAAGESVNGPIVLAAVGLAGLAIAAFSHSFLAPSAHPE